MMADQSSVLKAVEKADENAHYQRQLEKTIKSASSKSGKIKVGFPGGNEDLVVYWVPEMNIWWGTKPARNRFWNSFGIGEPNWGSTESHSIVCEANIPNGNLCNRKIATVLAKDDGGSVFLCHSGKIGGGKKGIGKKFFEENYNIPLPWKKIQDSRGLRNMLVIGSFLSSGAFLRQLSNFVREVRRIKKLSDRKAKSEEYDAILETVAGIESEDEEFLEGKRELREIVWRKRNQKIIDLKKKRSNYTCEICSFDFARTYGKIGDNYIVAHHLEPIGLRKRVTKTKISDLAIVCDNCHRMLHRKTPPFTPAELRSMIDETKEAKS